MRTLLGKAKVRQRIHANETRRDNPVVVAIETIETLPRVLLDAKKAFVLACVEQLVPVLSESVIQSQVYPLCHPYVTASAGTVPCC